MYLLQTYIMLYALQISGSQQSPIKNQQEEKESRGRLLEKRKNPVLIQVMELNSNLLNVEVGNIFDCSGRCVQE